MQEQNTSKADSTTETNVAPEDQDDDERDKSTH